MSVLKAAKAITLEHNVSIRVIDTVSGDVVQEHQGHNCATNSMLFGIGHYLIGDGVLNQGYDMLSKYVPQYISLGTMGLSTQNQDADGLPSGIGGTTGSETYRFQKYMNEVPGYGADGYDASENNGRPYFGLGPEFKNRQDTTTTINCELISDSFPRAQISFRDVVPETESELPKTIDVVFSAMISTGALKQFRPEGNNYLFITEAGLWATKPHVDSGENGLLAAYRIVPPDETNWDMTVAANRKILKENVIRVGINQVVQVIWKVQLGSIDELGRR